MTIPNKTAERFEKRAKRRSHFMVYGRFDHAAKTQRGKLTIDATKIEPLVTVRVHKKRVTYSMTLDDVAQLIVERALRLHLVPRRKRGVR